MTDLEKYKALLNSIGVEYEEELYEDSLLITVRYKYNEEEDGEGKVRGYGGFYCYWSFVAQTGKFEYIGIYE